MFYFRRSLEVLRFFDVEKYSSFNWITIVDMYKREDGRARQQQTRIVLRLKEVHVLRDSWTMLDVSPAKIMQIC